KGTERASEAHRWPIGGAHVLAEEAGALRDRRGDGEREACQDDGTHEPAGPTSHRPAKLRARPMWLDQKSKSWSPLNTLGVTGTRGEGRVLTSGSWSWA